MGFGAMPEGMADDGYIGTVNALDILGAIINSGALNNGRVYVNDELQVKGRILANVSGNDWEGYFQLMSGSDVLGRMGQDANGFHIAGVQTPAVRPLNLGGLSSIAIVHGLAGDGVQISGRLATIAEVFMDNLPTSDPNHMGQLWNNSGVLTVSAG